jgi:signal transduction histidine kinase
LQPVKDSEGKVQGLVLSLVNVTDRVRADQAYHKGLQRGALMAEFSEAIAQVGTDYQAVLDTITRKLAELLKGSCAIRMVSEDGKTLKLASLYHPYPETCEAFYQMVSAYEQPVQEGLAGQVFQCGEGQLISPIEFDQIRKSFSPAYVEYLKKVNIHSAIAMPLRIHGEVSGVLIVYNCPPEEPLTEWERELLQPAADRAALAIQNAVLYRDLQKTLELEQNMRIQLIQSEKYAALSRLVASVAHELNNPIQTIQNSLYLLQGNLSQEDSNRLFVEMAVSEGKRVANLVTQLRETYRPAKDLEAKTFDLVELVENFRVLITPHVQQNNVHLNIQYPKTPDCCQVKGIPDQIKQVLINISLNAIEAMQPEGGELAIELRISPEEAWAQIWIRDTGPGIDQRYLPQLFEPFFTTKPKGTGLGLSICYEIIQAHGGKITVESELGKGTAFIVGLPVSH